MISADKFVGDNLKGEMALFSFPLPSGGEELRGAPLVYPDFQLEENERLVSQGTNITHNNFYPMQLIWHDGVRSYMPVRYG